MVIGQYGFQALQLKHVRFTWAGVELEFLSV